MWTNGPLRQWSNERDSRCKIALDSADMAGRMCAEDAAGQLVECTALGKPLAGFAVHVEIRFERQTSLFGSQKVGSDTHYKRLILLSRRVDSERQGPAGNSFSWTATKHYADTIDVSF